MNIDELRSIAAKEEISLNYAAKDEMLSKVLLQLQNIDKIILKGGTAVNRVYISNKRFSEDIDFDIIFPGTILEAREKTKEIVKEVHGFTIEKPRIMNNTIRYDLFYTNPLQHKDRIQLEFQLCKKVASHEKKIVQFGFVPHPTVLLEVYTIEELIRQKIACILSRKEGKDYFDLYYLLDVRHKSLHLGKLEKEKILAAIPFDEKEIRSLANVINHYIPQNKRPMWGIFLEELREKIQKE